MHISLCLSCCLFSYPLLDSDLSIVLGHSDDVATLRAIQTIVRSMSALKQTEDQAIKPGYLSSELELFVTCSENETLLVGTYCCREDIVRPRKYY